jgi:YidC/Oxa1 family membrane protein insertase
MKKIIVMASVMLVLFVLSSCTQEDVVLKTYVNAPIKMVYTEAEFADGYVFKGDEGVTFINVKQSGAVETVPLDNQGINEPTGDTGVLTYRVPYSDVLYDFSIYVVPNDVGANDTEIVLVNFMLAEANVRTNVGGTENLEGLDVYVVRANGSVEILSAEDHLDKFSNNGFEPLQEDGFVSNEAFEVTFSYEGFTANFEVFVTGGEAPIHSEDAGFFDWILVIPVAFLTQLFGGIFGNSFAVGILITTLIVRTLAWPIYAKSNDLSLKMNLAQPEMQRVQNKYATRKDPQSQQQMQMEMMGVYKKYGINVLGCLLPFLQMPIFIAMYSVVRRITIPGGMYSEQVSNTMFFGINLANTNDGITAIILAGIVGATMFTLQRLAMKKPSYAKNVVSPNPQAQQSQQTMKYVSYFMVIMMMFISYQSNALAIYWIFGNVYSLTQTIINRKLSEKKHAKLKEKELLGGLAK